MADEDLQFQLELLNQLTDPVPENNLSRIFNTHNTGTIPDSSNNVTDNNTFFIDQPSLFSPTPINIPTNPITGNVVPAMIPTPPISLPAAYPAYPAYPTTYYNVTFPPIQDPTILTAPAVQEQHLEPNWEAINAFLRGQVRPGADVERLYTCHVCKAEYANAQALGGHMGMHRRSKNLRGEGSSSKSGPSKKPRRR